jgi:hypothetical protein
MVQVGLDFLVPHILGVTFIVKENELADPEDVGLLCFGAVVFLTTGDSDLFEQAWLLGFSRVTP